MYRHHHVQESKKSKGVVGGAGVRENSAAREVRGVCLVESAIRRLVLRLTREIRDCGVMSFAKAKRNNESVLFFPKILENAHFVSEAKRITCEKLGISS